jgi:hypothetical protein
LSKFVIIAVLSLAVGALGSSDGSISAELAGGALLLLAGFAPFTLLRLVPMVESGAVQQLEGVRHRAQRNALAGPRSAVAFALGHSGASGLPELTPGTGMGTLPDAPGAEQAGPPDPQGASGRAAPPETTTGVPMWRGVPQSDLELPAIPRSPSSDVATETTPPRWGAPVPLPARTSGQKSAHVIERDDLGPVLKWRPAAPPTPVDPSRHGD